MILLKTNLSVRNNSSCLRGTGVLDKGALDCTFMGVMFLDSFLQPTHTPSPHNKDHNFGKKEKYFLTNYLKNIMSKLCRLELRTGKKHETFINQLIDLSIRHLLMCMHLLHAMY